MICPVCICTRFFPVGNIIADLRLMMQSRSGSPQAGAGKVTPRAFLHLGKLGARRDQAPEVKGFILLSQQEELNSPEILLNVSKDTLKVTRSCREIQTCLHSRIWSRGRFLCQSKEAA